MNSNLSHTITTDAGCEIKVKQKERILTKTELSLLRLEKEIDKIGRELQNK